MSGDVHGDNEMGAKPAIIRPGARALVQCRDFRCLAYCDDKGVWRDSERGEVLPEVLKILEEFNS